MSLVVFGLEIVAFHSVGEIFGNTIGNSPDLHRFLKASGFGNKTANFGKGAETWPRGHFPFDGAVKN